LGLLGEVAGGTPHGADQVHATLLENDERNVAAARIAAETADRPRSSSAGLTPATRAVQAAHVGVTVPDVAGQAGSEEGRS